MEFSVLDYTLPTCGLFILSWLLLILVCCYYIIKRVKAPNNRSIILFVPLALFTIVIFSLIHAIPAVSHWGGLVFTKSREITSGYVEKIEKATVFPLYWNRKNTSFTSASHITISGKIYYILSDLGIEEGSAVTITYCPNGNTILRWENMLTQNGISTNTTIKENSSNQDSFSSKKQILEEEQIVVIIAITLAVFVFFREGFAAKRLQYMCNHSEVIYGLVYPRKISFMTCTVEFLITFWAVLCICTGNTILMILLSVMAICLWGLRFAVQKTSVIYEAQEFTYVTIGRAKKYSISSVNSIYFSPTRQTHCKQLRIILKSGYVLTLEELNFVGLDDFYQWLKEGVQVD